MELENLKPDRGKRVMDDDDFDAAISDNIKAIMSAFRQFKSNAQKDGQNKNKAQKDVQNKNEEIISSVASHIKSSLDKLKSDIVEQRQIFDKELSETSKECQNLLKAEVAKFQDLYEEFCKEKAAYLRALKDEEEKKEKRFVKYEELRKKKEEALLSEYEKANATRIAQLEESLKKKKQDDKTFSILRKNEEMISSVASDIKSSLDELKSKLEEVRQSFVKELSESSKACENLLKPKAAKFKVACEMFKEKAASLEAFEDVITKFKEGRQGLYVRYDELIKHEADLLSDREKEYAVKIAELEEPMKKKKREDNIYSLVKTLGSDAYSLEMGMLQMVDFPPDD